MASVPVSARLPTDLLPWPAPPAALCLCCPWLPEGEGLPAGDMPMGLLLAMTLLTLLTDGAFGPPAKL